MTSEEMCVQQMSPVRSVPSRGDHGPLHLLAFATVLVPPLIEGVGFGRWCPAAVGSAQKCSPEFMCSEKRTQVFGLMINFFSKCSWEVNRNLKIQTKKIKM